MGEQKKYWEGKHFAFYTNKECEYYPCHPVPEDCSECLVPHRRENYGFIADSFQKIAGEMAEREKKEGQ